MAVGLKWIFGAGLLLAAGIALSGCNTMKIDDFAGKQPALKPESYFLGETRGSGMFHDRFGNLRRQFVVDMLGEMEGDILVLTEDFLYDDGEKEQRIWHLKPLGSGRYEGVAGDVIGTASGQAAGNAFQWSYKLDLKVGNGRWRVAFDDWMFLQPGGVVLNRATVTRWGVEIGTLTVSFHKKDAGSAFLRTQPQSVAQAAE
jgi:hypothetical protein